MVNHTYEDQANILWSKRRDKAAEWEPLAKALSKAPKEALAYQALARAMLDQLGGNYAQAQEAIALAKKTFYAMDQELWVARCLLIEGFLHINMEQIFEALEAWKQAYQLAQDKHDREVFINALYSIAIANRVHLERYEDAINQFEQVLKFCLEMDPPFYLTGNVYSGLSKCYMSLGNPQLAQHFAGLALSFARLYGDAKTLGWSLELSATTALTMGDLTGALAFAEENLELWLEIGDAYGLAVAYNDMLTIERRHQNLKKAFEYGQKALTYGQHIQSSLLLEPLYKEMAALAQDLGNLNQALEYYQSYMQHRELSLKASFNREVSRVAGELKLENYKLRHVELQSKIDALKEAQQALIKSEKMNALLGLVGGVAHEINTPLGNSMTLNSYAISECEQILKRSAEEIVTSTLMYETLEEVYQAQQRIELGLQTVAHIVDSFKRIAVNPKQIHFEAVNIKDFLESWKMGLKQLYPEYKGNVLLDCPGQLTLEIDIIETMKLLDELFLNAMQHGYGHLKQEGDHGSLDAKVLVIVDHESPLSITFKDFGQGMEAQILEHIFEPFVKGNNLGKGLGIGMHVVYNVVVFVLGGSIDVVSNPDSGTAVYVKFGRSI